tara:strand:- start:4282 stop:5397 length:1116 start_codon:yes stop_codon:yes gene_type:complete
MASILDKYRLSSNYGANPSSDYLLGSANNANPMVPKPKPQNLGLLNLSSNSNPMMGLLGNPLFAIGTALLNPRQSFGQNLQQGFQNLMQQQMYKQEQERKNRADMMQLALLQKQLKPTARSIQSFETPDGNLVTGYLTDSGLVGTDFSPMNLPPGSKPFRPPQFSFGDKDYQKEIKLANIAAERDIKVAEKKADIDATAKLIADQYKVLQGAKRFSEDLNVIDQLLTKAQSEGGIGPEIINTIAGISPEFAKYVSGKSDDELAALRTASQFIERAVPAQRIAGSGTTSDRDMQAFRNALIGLKDDSLKRQLALAFAKRLQDREQAYESYLTNNRKDYDSLVKNRAKALKDIDKQFPIDLKSIQEMYREEFY